MFLWKLQAINVIMQSGASRILNGDIGADEER